MITERMNTILDIGNKVLFIINISGFEIWITESLVSTWIIMGVLIVFAVIARILLRRFREIPAGVQNAVESLVEIVDKFVTNVAGDKLIKLSPWFFMIILFVFTSNISGIVGLRPPTSEWSTTIALSLCTFLLIHITAIKYRKKDYLKSFLQPFFLFLPLNIISELAKPISLSFRLFGNMLSGLILMTIVYTLPVYLRFVIPVPLHVYFDVAIGALQTYIFCMLSLSFIRSAASAGE